jgi:hypothetical protein
MSNFFIFSMKKAIKNASLPDFDLNFTCASFVEIFWWGISLSPLEHYSDRKILKKSLKIFLSALLYENLPLCAIYIKILTLSRYSSTLYLLSEHVGTEKCYNIILKLVKIKIWIFANYKVASWNCYQQNTLKNYIEDS